MLRAYFLLQQSQFSLLIALLQNRQFLGTRLHLPRQPLELAEPPLHGKNQWQSTERQRSGWDAKMDPPRRIYGRRRGRRKANIPRTYVHTK